MSSDRNAQGRPPPGKPTLPTPRTTRAPLTPRLAVNATPSTGAPRTPTVRSNPPSTAPRPRLPQVAPRVANTTNKDADRSANLAPRPIVRSARTDGPSEITPPSTGLNSNSLRGRPTLAAPGSNKDRSGSSSGLGIGVGNQNRPRVAQARSDVGSTRAHIPLVRSPGHSESGHPQPDNVNSRPRGPRYSSTRMALAKRRWPQLELELGRIQWLRPRDHPTHGLIQIQSLNL
jgi:hypothetical protein